jgi:Amt family ammonium transporter
MMVILLPALLLAAIGFPSFAAGAESGASPAMTMPSGSMQSEAPVAAAPAATPSTAPAAAPAPNKGDTAWMLTATALVILMTIPGLALFYGGLVRSKNMLSMLMQVFMIFSLIVVLWSLYGYSLAFTEGGRFIGSFDRLFLKGMSPESVTGTFSKGVVLPEYAYVAFQATFAAITCGLVVGAFAERVKFPAVLLFIVLWFTFSYLPIAHMVWFWPGPDAFTDAAAAEKATAAAGWLFAKGALDFAGGTVVHINAAMAGLVGAFVIGKRIGYGRESMAPHSLTLTMVGASMLWVGWFGFNAGSALESGGTAALAFVNTLLATAIATLSWSFGEWMSKGKPSMLGAASGAVAGLVAITPASGYVDVSGALLIGIGAGVVCYFAVQLRSRWKRVDDALDVWAVHGIGGTWGAIATGLFATVAIHSADTGGVNGLLYGNPDQLL